MTLNGQFYKVNRVLLTGCSGVIGSGITRELLTLGFTVYGTSNRNSCNIQHSEHLCRKVDLLNTNIHALVESVKPDILVHTSWVTEHQEFWDSELNEQWVLTTLELLRAFSKNRHGYFLGVGSSAEYSDQFDGPLTVGEHEGPTTKYGIGKLKVLNSIKDSNLNFGWGRVFYQYTLDKNEKKLISALYNSALAKSKFLIRDPDSEYDFVHKDDVVRNFVHMIELRHTGVVNFGSGRAETVKSIASFIDMKTGGNNFLYQIPDIQPRKRIVANTLGNTMLGFKWKSVFEVLDSPSLWQLK